MSECNDFKFVLHVLLQVDMQTVEQCAPSIARGAAVRGCARPTAGGAQRGAQINKIAAVTTTADGKEGGE